MLLDSVYEQSFESSETQDDISIEFENGNNMLDNYITMLRTLDKMAEYNFTQKDMENQYIKKDKNGRVRIYVNTVMYIDTIPF